MKFDCKSIQDTPLVAEVYYSRNKYQWRCNTVVKGRELDFDLAYIVNNGKVKIVGNKLEGYEHE